MLNFTMKRRALSFFFVSIAVACVAGCGIKTYGVMDQNLPIRVAYQKLAYDTQLESFSEGAIDAAVTAITGDDDESGNDDPAIVLDDNRRRAIAIEESLGGVPNKAFHNTIDRCARWLTSELPTSRAGQGSTKNILVFYDTTGPGNRSVGNETAGFKKLVTTLGQSDVLQNHFIFLDQDEQAGREALEQVALGQAGRFDPTGTGELGELTAYHPDLVWLVTTDFSSNESLSKNMPSAGRLEYTLTVTVTHAVKRRIDLQNQFSEAFRFHPYAMQWISETENRRLQNAFKAAKSGRSNDLTKGASF